MGSLFIFLCVNDGDDDDVNDDGDDDDDDNRCDPKATGCKRLIWSERAKLRHIDEGFIFCNDDECDIVANCHVKAFTLVDIIAATTTNKSNKGKEGNEGKQMNDLSIFVRHLFIMSFLTCTYAYYTMYLRIPHS